MRFSGLRAAQKAANFLILQSSPRPHLGMVELPPMNRIMLELFCSRVRLTGRRPHVLGTGAIGGIVIGVLKTKNSPAEFRNILEAISCQNHRDQGSNRVIVYSRYNSISSMISVCLRYNAPSQKLCSVVIAADSNSACFDA
jgi:hypothetical protein